MGTKLSRIDFRRQYVSAYQGLFVCCNAKRMIKDQTATDYWLERGDYVNFDYLTLGWAVPVKNIGLFKDIRLAFTISNLGTITGYSGLTPLVNSMLVDSTLGVDDKRTYPLTRTYSVSLSLNL